MTPLRVPTKNASNHALNAMADLNNQLIVAAFNGDLDRVKLLVAQGADPAYKGANGRNAIFYLNPINAIDFNTK